jgi:hypothetical protein
MFFWAIRLKKSYLHSMGYLPLDNETPEHRPSTRNNL